MTIGDRIREVRLKRGMTQADLGGDLVTPSMVSQIESNRVKPSHTLLMEFSKRLGTPVEYFLQEMDQQALVSAQLALASHALAMGRPQEASDLLRDMASPLDHGANHEQYCLIQAQVCRALKQYPEATNYLEHLREYAYRFQDTQLLFVVCRESGYVEFEQGNVTGAIYEWKRAVEYGRTLRDERTVPKLDLARWMLDVLLKLDQFDEAEEWIQDMSTLRGAAEDLFAQAMSLVTVDPNLSKELCTRAATLTTFAQLFEQVLTVRARSEANAIDSLQSAQETAFAMTALYPETYLTSACNQIESLLQADEIDRAKSWMNQVTSVLANLTHQPMTAARRDIGHRLELLTAQMEAKAGSVIDAIRRLERFEATFPEDGNIEYKRQACALLVLLYGEQDDIERTVAYARKMDELIPDRRMQLPILL
ncbi:helix-turn-helix domain-containing protein [Alicyclobacillus acidiphilus]|uniref:helix-turn-helix domain-containing protein n=1 Tax=Alicyclobacillus acidiphilus TaxID=182455 RepID=UPI000A46EF15|nr:helix-turn-helix domain-containing protein [Alicyclobacillus acidiphilus]